MGYYVLHGLVGDMKTLTLICYNLNPLSLLLHSALAKTTKLLLETANTHSAILHFVLKSCNLK